jgi:hypothetical protein
MDVLLWPEKNNSLLIDYTITNQCYIYTINFIDRGKWVLNPKHLLLPKIKMALDQEQHEFEIMPLHPPTPQPQPPLKRKEKEKEKKQKKNYIFF